MAKKPTATFNAAYVNPADGSLLALPAGMDVANLKSGKIWYYKYILFFMCLLPLGSSAHEREDGLYAHCEYRLLNPSRQQGFFRRFNKVLGPAGFSSEIRVNKLATPIAIRKFGIDGPTNNLILNGERSGVTANNFVIEVQRLDKLLFKVPIRLPPLYLWKRSYDGDNQKFDEIPDFSESWRDMSLGSIFENGFQIRKFISIERGPRETTVVTLGIDVDCEMVRNYSFRNPRNYILFQPEHYLCRVPVLVAELKDL
ncbi:MAG: hypothetical protein ACXVA9_01255 [Bdellovibrionales bacterium]